MPSKLTFPTLQRLRPALAALLAVAALSCEQRDTLLRDDGFDGPEPYDVRVVDAEILLIDGQRIHLANVDAPAIIPTSRCWGEAVAARGAVQALQTMVREGRTVEVRQTGQRDPLGRALAHVLIDGLDVGDALYAQSLVARPGAQAFRWCEPMSRSRDGAPPMDPLFALSR